MAATIKMIKVMENRKVRRMIRLSIFTALLAVNACSSAEISGKSNATNESVDWDRFTVSTEKYKRDTIYLASTNSCYIRISVANAPDESDGASMFIGANCDFTNKQIANGIKFIADGSDLANRFKHITSVIYQGVFDRSGGIKHWRPLIESANMSEAWPVDIDLCLSSEEQKPGCKTNNGAVFFKDALIESELLKPLEMLFESYGYNLRFPEGWYGVEEYVLITRDELIEKKWFSRSELRKKLLPYQSSYIFLDLSRKEKKGDALNLPSLTDTSINGQERKTGSD